MLGGLKWGITSPRRPERYLEVDGHRFSYGTSRYYQFTIRPKEPLSGISVGGAGLLGRCDLCQRDVEAQPPVAQLGGRLYKTSPWVEDLYLLSFPHRARVRPPLHCLE
jgi:hypothetical protein